jgi:hypothetical protein
VPPLTNSRQSVPQATQPRSRKIEAKAHRIPISITVDGLTALIAIAVNRWPSGECRPAAARALSCPYHAGRFHLACPLSGDAWRVGTL